MRSTKMIVGAAAAVTLLALSGARTPARAQLASASAATLGKGGNATATVRGFAAIGVNPAGLGMPGGPGFSLALAPAQVRVGLDPITLSDFKNVEGKLIGNATKEDWLSRVAAEGGQSGPVDIEVSELAVTVGRIGLQVSTLVSANVTLSPDLVELALYGNAGRTGQPESFSLGGSGFDGFAVTTAGVSFGLPVNTATGSLAFGATVKYSVGHGVAIGEERSGSVSSDPIRVNVDLPIIHTNQDKVGNVGTGVGVDVGFQYRSGNVAIGAAVQNVLNTFGWDASTMDYRPVRVDLRGGEFTTEVDAMAIGQAPATLVGRLDAMKFKPMLAVGGAYDVSPDFTVTADLKNRFGDGLDVGPKFHLGAGAEYRGLRILHLRGGAALITDGIQYGGGASLVLGPVNLTFAGALQTGDLKDTTVAMFGLSFGSN